MPITIQDAEAKMNAVVARMTTAQIVEAIRLIGGGRVENDQAFVRTVLLCAYEDREGYEPVDALLTELGM